MKATSLVGLLLAGLLTHTAAGALVYDNGGPSEEEAIASDFANLFQIADDFSLPGATDLTSVQWWGLYSFGDPPVPTDDFTLRIFANEGDGEENNPVNGAPLYEQVVGNVGRSLAGLACCGGSNDLPIYEYSAAINPPQLGGGLYWLSVVNRTTGFERNWSWTVSSLQGNAFHREDDLDDWDTRFFDSEPSMAFNLSGTVDTSGATIVEFFDEQTQRGEFTVQNNSANDVAAFLVENTLGGDFDASVTGDALELGWEAFVVHEEDWSSAEEFAQLVGGDIESWPGPDVVDWVADLGFSPGSSAFVYYVYDLLADETIGPGETAGGFRFEAPGPESNFAIFSSTGALLTTGETIPEPAALVLMGLGALALLRRGAA